MKKGLVLEGGAMRGIFTAGVLDVFMEHDITFDGLIGTSAGAVFGCNYKSKQIGRTIRYNLKYCKDPRYASFFSLFLTGDYYGAKFCYEDLPNHLDPFDVQAFQDNPMEFYLTCTDLHTGNTVYHQCKTGDATDITWMRASASVPLVSTPVKLDGYEFLDGGISDAIPIKYFESIGYEKNVVILTQAPNYQKEKNKLLPLIKISLKRYPKAIEAIANRHNIYNQTLDYIRQQVSLEKSYVIQPNEKLPIKNTCKSPVTLQYVYEIGRAEGERHLTSVMDFLK